MTQTAKPLIGLGATLSIGTQGGTPTYTVINGLKQVSGPQPKWGTEDVTTLDSAAFNRVFVKTLLDPGEISVSGNWESADPGQTALASAFAVGSNSTNGAAFPFKLALAANIAGGQATTGDTFGFSALVTAFEGPDIQVDKVATFKATLRITGGDTETVGS